MARVPGGFGINDVMGVRRPDRSVALDRPVDSGLVEALLAQAGQRTDPQVPGRMSNIANSTLGGILSQGSHAGVERAVSEWAAQGASMTPAAIMQRQRLAGGIDEALDWVRPLALADLGVSGVQGSMMFPFPGLAPGVAPAARAARRAGGGVRGALRRLLGSGGDEAVDAGTAAPRGWLGERAAASEGRQAYAPGPWQRDYPGAPRTPRDAAPAVRESTEAARRGEADRLWEYLANREYMPYWIEGVPAGGAFAVPGRPATPLIPASQHAQWPPGSWQHREGYTITTHSQAAQARDEALRLLEATDKPVRVSDDLIGETFGLRTVRGSGDSAADPWQSTLRETTARTTEDTRRVAAEIAEFDALPDDAWIRGYHGTTPESAQRLRMEGAAGGRGVRQPVAPYAGHEWTGEIGVFVTPTPASAAAYAREGGEVLEMVVRKGDLRTPHQFGLRMPVGETPNTGTLGESFFDTLTGVYVPEGGPLRVVRSHKITPELEQQIGLMQIRAAQSEPLLPPTPNPGSVV